MTPVGTKNIIRAALFSGYGNILVKKSMEMFNGNTFMVTLRENIVIQIQSFAYDNEGSFDRDTII